MVTRDSRYSQVVLGLADEESAELEYRVLRVTIPGKEGLGYSS